MKYLIIVPFIIFSSLSNGQNLGYKITYNFFHIIDTNNIGTVHKELMALSLDKNAAEYYSETDKLQDELWKKKIDEAEKTGNTHINMGLLVKTTNERLFIYPQQKKIFIVKKFQNNKYEIPDQLSDFKWQITNKTKVIKGYNCQLATGYWRGRRYEAWFTSDLPYSFGPWKLNGLPGLILEAADATNTVRFECDSIAKSVEVEINLPEDAIVTSQKEFDRMEQSMKKVNKQLSSGNSDITVEAQQISGPVKVDKSHKTPTFNNPIELKLQ